MRSKIGAVALVVLVFGVACTPPGRPAGTSFVIAGCEPVDLIPQNQVYDCDGQYLEVLFTGLSEFDRQTGKVVNMVARSITSTDDITWTIKLHDGWTFHNGEPVTAHSFVDAWNWAANPVNHASASDWSWIEGYEDVNPGEGKKPTATTMSGLKVLDRLTFQVKLLAPFDYGGKWWTGYAFEPLPQAFFRDPKAWREMPIGDGPYQFDGPWKHNTAIDLKRYPGYRGTPGLADRIEFRMYGDTDCFPDLERGLIDICHVAESNFRAARRDFGDRLVQRGNSAKITSIYFPLYDPKYRDKDLRQALSLALDRAAITSDAYQGIAVPATSLLAPQVPGHRNDACSYCGLDVAIARQKLAASGWQGTLDLFSQVEGVNLEAAQAVAEQWRRNLGIDVVVHPLPVDELEARAGPKELHGVWWDVTTLEPFTEWWVEGPYSTNGDLNQSGYSNPQVDRLIAAGNTAGGPAETISYYQRAEDLILEDLPEIPLWYPRDFIAYSKRIANVSYPGDVDYIGLERIRVVG
jgi:oligopeptide transport system substrate-binding protein